METSVLPVAALDQMAGEAIQEALRRRMAERDRKNDPWLKVARPNQLPPKGDWIIWLLLAGRGFGKTRTGSETTRRRVMAGKAGRLGFVGPTAADVRDVMVEGPSGILAVSPDSWRPHYEPSKRRLTWPNGAVATLFSSDEPDRLRGPQHDYVWGDEVASWRYPEAYDMMMLGLRVGERPQAVLTSTPKPIPLIRDLVKRDGQDVVVTKGTTYENLENLAPAFKTEVIRRYEGTRLGRQELNAEILDDVPGALWTRALIEECRVSPEYCPPLKVAYCAIDPAVTAHETSDETGIMIGGVGEDGHGYVISDLSGIFTPDAWARRAVNATLDDKLNGIVAEVNNGGDLVKNTIRHVEADDGAKIGQRVRVLEVRATKGKYTRAEPVASLYEQHRIHHVGSFPALEDQLCTWVPGEKSPDRLDALVWLMTKVLVESMGSRVLFEA
jgi:phage terminase large subunit-like protein